MRLSLLTCMLFLYSNMTNCTMAMQWTLYFRMYISTCIFVCTLRDPHV